MNSYMIEHYSEGRFACQSVSFVSLVVFRSSLFVAVFVVCSEHISASAPLRLDAATREANTEREIEHLSLHSQLVKKTSSRFASVCLISSPDSFSTPSQIMSSARITFILELKRHPVLEVNPLKQVPRFRKLFANSVSSSHPVPLP